MGLNGLMMKSSAPSCSSRMRSVLLSSPERITTGTEANMRSFFR